MLITTNDHETDSNLIKLTQLIKKKDAIKAFLFVNFKLYTYELVKKIKHSLITGVKELSMQSRIYNHFPQKEFSLNPKA